MIRAYTKDGALRERFWRIDRRPDNLGRFAEYDYAAGKTEIHHVNIGRYARGSLLRQFRYYARENNLILVKANKETGKWRKKRTK